MILFRNGSPPKQEIKSINFIKERFTATAYNQESKILGKKIMKKNLHSKLSETK